MRHPSFAHLDHRPWPPPSRPWVSAQRWWNLAFLHWPIEARLLRPLVPATLEIDEFEGAAWIGVVPFRMMIRPRLCPPLPGLSYFPELNVRTYVRIGDRPGVWFFSLDASNPLAVWGARRYFHLPYFRAAMRAERADGATRYASERRDGAARFRGAYRPTGDVGTSKPGTAEHWLTERYCLYAVDTSGALHRGEIHHGPWPLQAGEVHIEENTMLAPLGLPMPEGPPLVHYARRIEVTVWWLARVEA